MVRPRRLLILDFDGTLTDTEAESVPFRAGYLEDLALLTGWELARVHEAAARHEAAMDQDPRQEWTLRGRYLPSARGDPYLRIGPVSRKILDEAGMFLAEPDRTRLLDRILFRNNYRLSSGVFRAGAVSLLRELGTRPGLETRIVTNSETEAVRRRLDNLDRAEGGVRWILGRIHGSAGKFAIDEHFDAVPEALELPGLDRPLPLRQARYHALLDGIRGELGLAWDQVVVVGDLFELDLVLPLYLGARVALMPRGEAPAWARAWLEAHGGRVLEGPGTLPAWLDDG